MNEPGLLKEYYNLYFKSFYKIEFEEVLDSHIKFLENSLGFYSFKRKHTQE